MSLTQRACLALCIHSQIPLSKHSTTLLHLLKSTRCQGAPSSESTVSTDSPVGLQSLALINSWSAGSYRDTQQSSPLTLLFGHLCVDVHACPSNEDLLCTYCYAWLAYHSTYETMVTASSLTKVLAIAFE